ncbi:MAG TPA: aminoacyl-tRNA hydrolase [Casimicrobiaceae bacterium]|nr:aminoacyl-tRNA hydrolase [Casimicrobiaceae bacterium]
MALPLRLFVGLGNPGRRYASTRHNAGAWFVDRLARLLDLELRSESRFQSLVARGRAPDGGDFRLALPQSYMNESGNPVASLARYYRIPPAEILVAHDELDLKPGSVKLKLGGGSAGHNGLNDVVEQLGVGDFWRLRIGIGHPRDAELAEAEVVDYVLHPPRAEDKAQIDDAIARALAVWPDLVSGDTERAMLALHTRRSAARPSGGEGSAGA